MSAAAAAPRPPVRDRHFLIAACEAVDERQWDLAESLALGHLASGPVAAATVDGMIAVAVLLMTHRRRDPGFDAWRMLGPVLDRAAGLPHETRRRVLRQMHRMLDPLLGFQHPLLLRMRTLMRSKPPPPAPPHLEHIDDGLKKKTIWDLER